MTITQEKFSKKREVSKHDIMSIITTAGLLLIPVLFDIQASITAGKPINWSVVAGACMGVLIKTLQKILTDYNAKLGE